MAKGSITTTVDADARTVTFDCGEAGTIVVFVDSMSAETTTQALLHGIKQKVGDAAAMSAGASIFDKYDAMLEVADRLNQGGSWNATRGTGESSDLLVRAVIEAYGCTRAQAEEAIKPLNRKARDAMRADPEIAPILARLRKPDAESASAASAALAALRG